MLLANYLREDGCLVFGCVPFASPWQPQFLLMMALLRTGFSLPDNSSSIANAAAAAAAAGSNSSADGGVLSFFGDFALSSSSAAAARRKLPQRKPASKTVYVNIGGIVDGARIMMLDGYWLHVQGRYDWQQNATASSNGGAGDGSHHAKVVPVANDELKEDSADRKPALVSRRGDRRRTSATGLPGLISTAPPLAPPLFKTVPVEARAHTVIWNQTFRLDVPLLPTPPHALRLEVTTR